MAQLFRTLFFVLPLLMSCLLPETVHAEFITNAHGLSRVQENCIKILEEYPDYSFSHSKAELVEFLINELIQTNVDNQDMSFHELLIAYLNINEVNSKLSRLLERCLLIWLGFSGNEETLTKAYRHRKANFYNKDRDMVCQLILTNARLKYGVYQLWKENRLGWDIKLQNLKEKIIESTNFWYKFKNIFTFDTPKIIRKRLSAKKNKN